MTTFTRTNIQLFVQMLIDENISQSEKQVAFNNFVAKKFHAIDFTHLIQSLIEINYPTQPFYENAMCVCGTGGDQSNSFNISTVTSIVVSSGGVPIIKHGNKSVTSKSGSVDILEAMGIDRVQVSDATHVVNNQNIAFIAASDTYPMFKHIMPLRKQVPYPTVFNLVGPLVHPFKLEYQLMGVFKKDYMEMIAKTMQHLGRKRAIIVHGAGGMDEATLCGDNIIYEVSPTNITSYTIRAEDVGLTPASNVSLKGGTPHENKNIALNILNGEQSSRRDVVLLNAGLAFYAACHTDSIQEGINLAAKCIDSKHALNKYLKIGGRK